MREVEEAGESRRSLQAELDESKAAFAEQMLLAEMRLSDQTGQLHDQRNISVRKILFSQSKKSINRSIDRSNHPYSFTIKKNRWTYLGG